MHNTIEGPEGRPFFWATGIPNVESLYDLARDDHPQSRQQLTFTVSKILDTDLSYRETELLSDVLISLLKQAEKDFRLALSERFSVMDSIPLRLALHLANDEIEIAAPVLENSRVLGDFDLLYIIKSKPAEYWRAIAKRHGLSENVMEELANCDDFDTSLALVENTGITLNDTVMSILADKAQGYEQLALPLLRRDEVGEDIAQALYRYVGVEIRKFICENYDVNTAHVDQAVAQVKKEFGSDVSREIEPEDYMIEAAQAHMDKGSLSVPVMLSALRRGHLRTFVAQISVFTGLSCSLISKVLSQGNGQGLAIIAKAYNFKKSDFVSMFMLTNKLWNYGRMVESRDLHRAIHYFDRIEQDKARALLLSHKTTH